MNFVTEKNMAPYIIATLIFLISHVDAVDNITFWKKTPPILSTVSPTISHNGDIEFHLYSKTHPYKYNLKLYDEINFSNIPLNRDKKTMIFIHGFGESAEDVTPLAIANAYLEFTDYNVIVVDWQNLAASPWYFQAANNVQKVGSYVAKLVKWLDDKKAIKMSELHVIGFSLGAHAAGYVGKSLGPQKIGRITGLDPAGPTFNDASVYKRLHKSDAIFVDVIHTNYRGCGLRKPIGHADFYPNDGNWQPGCKVYDIQCSHSRARLYYIESIRQRFGFPAKKCREWMPTLKNCFKYPAAYMGFMADSNTHGIFLLSTNSKPPYARYLDDYPHFDILETSV